MARLVGLMNSIAGVILFLLPFLIVADIVSRRFFGAPILGTYDLTEEFGGLLIFLAIPFSTFKKQHVTVDLLTETLGPTMQLTLNLVTRCMGVILFVVIGWYLILKGLDFYSTGEVSSTLRLPLYPGTFVASLCCFVQSFVLIVDGVSRVKRSRVG